VTALAEAPPDIPENIRRIPLGDGHVAIVDAAEYPSLIKFSWRLLRGHKGKLYAYTSVSGRATYMHRLVAGTPKGFETDHINGDGLDNRRANLRLATSSQNRANMWKPRRPDRGSHTSIYKGVTWDKSRGKWQSKINHEGRCRNLGRYDSEVDAAHAYDAAAITAWGAFARLNFPRGDAS
jgi:hypothetical protein